ncbi:hypothetical protein [Mesorhizobium tamadayense]|nr:hypothetical protein [Mesorhizobium tamadayense]
MNTRTAQRPARCFIDVLLPAAPGRRHLGKDVRDHQIDDHPISSRLAD